MTTPNQRFTVGLVPTLPPAPTASATPTPAVTPPPASAADTVTGEDGRDLANRLFNRPGVAGITAADSLAIHALVDRAEAAEAERDRLRAELAAVRGAMPDPQMLDMYAEGIEWEGYDASGLRKAAAAIRAALATATATPQAAGTGTGGEDQGADWTDCDCGLCAQCNGQAIRQAPVWTREAPIKPGEYWAIVDRWSEPAPQMVSLKVAEAGDTWWASDSYDDTYGYSPRQILLWGPIAVTSIPSGWQSALAALDTPREADHAQ